MFTKRLGVLLALVFLFHASHTTSTTCYANTCKPIAVSDFAGYSRSIVQVEVNLLKIGEALKREIARDQVESFGIELSAGQYAEVVFEWQGINLIVALFDPTGATLIPSDVQVSSPGPVSVSILAEKSGSYQLQVRTPVKQKISGKYELRLEESRLPTAADRNRLAAQNQIAEGQSASSGAAKIQNYNRALALLQEAGDINGEARVRMLLGDAYRAARDLQKAKASFEQAVLIWNKHNYPRGEAYAKVSLGLLYRSLAAPKDALTHYEQARLLFAQLGDLRGQADAFYGHAFALMLIGQTPEAIEGLRQTVQIRRADGDRMGEASALNMMADAYRLLGDFDKCLDLYDQATTALSGLEHRSLEALLINNRALVYDDQGYWQKAKDEYARTLSAYESLLGQSVLSACSANPSSQDAPICRSAALILLNLGEVYNSFGEPEKALQEFSRSLSIHDALGQPVGQGSARFHLGYAHFLLGDTGKALDYYQKALEFQQRAGDEKGKALTYTYMGMAYTARNEPRLALELYQKALPIQQTSGDKRSLAISLDKLATGYSMVGNATEASLNYAKALELWRAIKDPDGEALTLHNLALAERAAGNFAAAGKNAEASIKLVESMRTRLTSERLRASYLANKENYYEVDIDLKMQLAKSENRNYIAAALESNEKARARVLLDSLNEAGVGRVEFNQSSDVMLAGLVEQRLGLLAKLGAKARVRTNLLSEKHTPEQLAAIDKDIVEITEKYDQSEAQVRSKSPQFAALTKPQPSTLKEIQQQLDASTILLEYSLGEKRSYVWVVSANSIHGFELPGRDQIEPVARLATEALTARNREEKNESWPQRQARITRSEAEYSEASAALSKLVLDPVASLLGQKRLVIVADGVLQMIPFAALPVPNSSSVAQKVDAIRTNAIADAMGPRPLISEHEIITLPSASVLALQRRELANRKLATYALAVLADPVFDDQDVRVAKATGIGNQHRKETANTGKGGEVISPQGEKSSSSRLSNANSALSGALRDVGMRDGKLPRLALSRQEARAIARAVLPGQSFSALDFKASRETATSPELSKYRIIHFATHGVLDLEHPELSGIVLSMVDEKGRPQDGYLRLHEIYNLNLPAELVVLSACQTGVGKQVKGEGLIALTRGFMYAGAARVVASLWKVDDAASSELMAEFYKQMFTNKLKPAAALRSAQVKMSRQKRWQSPYYWAGFFLQGEWN